MTCRKKDTICNLYPNKKRVIKLKTVDRVCFNPNGSSVGFTVGIFGGKISEYISIMTQK